MHLFRIPVILYRVLFYDPLRYFPLVIRDSCCTITVVLLILNVLFGSLVVIFRAWYDGFRSLSTWAAHCSLTGGDHTKLHMYHE